MNRAITCLAIKVSQRAGALGAALLLLALPTLTSAKPLTESSAQSSKATSSSTIATLPIGVVDVRRVLDESKFGKEEQRALESLGEELQGSLAKTQRELEDLVRRSQDPEYLESLSAKAEEELQMAGQSLSQNYMAQTNQFKKIMGEAEMHLLEELNLQVSRAAQIVARAEGLAMCLRQEACPYFLEQLNITDAIIDEMDKAYSQKPKEAAAATSKIPGLSRS